MAFNYFLKKITQTRDILKRFREAGAFNSQFAKPLKELDLRYSPPLNKLIRHRVIVDAGERKYFLDERAMLNYRMKLPFSLLNIFNPMCGNLKER